MKRKNTEDKQHCISGCQLRQYPHISTQKLNFIMDNGLMPHINTGHATHKSPVLKKDAYSFPERTETDQNSVATPKGKFLNRKNHLPRPFFDVTEENRTTFAAWLEKKRAELPDALPALTAAQISGHKAQRIRELIKENVLTGITVNRTQYIPKSDFIAYLSKPEKLAAPRTEACKELIREFKKRLASERENEIRRQNRQAARKMNQL